MSNLISCERFGLQDGQVFDFHCFKNLSWLLADADWNLNKYHLGVGDIRFFDLFIIRSRLVGQETFIGLDEQNKEQSIYITTMRIVVPNDVVLPKKTAWYLRSRCNAR